MIFSGALTCAILALKSSGQDLGEICWEKNGFCTGTSRKAYICKMKFAVLHKDKESKARAGKLVTDHGEVDTPVFMPVGTLATVRGVLHRDLVEDIKAQIILAIRTICI